MNQHDWIEELYALLARFSDIGVDADIASMSLWELWALYRFLLRLAEG